MRWFDNKSVIMFWWSRACPSVTRYDRSQHKKVQVTQPDIVRFYNQYMGRVDKLNMMCKLCKPSLRTKCWYIYIWLHSILIIAAINAWFLYRRDLKTCKPNGKFIQLKRFPVDLAQSLVKTVRPVTRPSRDEF